MKRRDYMKRDLTVLLTVVLTVALAAAFSGCAEEPDVGVADGTHRGVSDPDQHGYVEVELVVEGGSVTEVAMTEYSSDGTAKDPATYPWEEFGEAVETLPQQVIETQSADVDVVAGATNTSEKFRQATRRALQAEEPFELGPFIDGVYQASSDADEHGHVEVEVYILLGHIIDVEWDEYDGDGEWKDPDEYDWDEWQEAIDELPARVVKAQSAEVDVVAGATNTSEKFSQAVERALQDATE